MADLLVLDGSAGEGGGQIVRTALGLSLVTNQPFRLENIRARRSKPGLQRQHLAAVLAARQVGGATVCGAELGSGKLEFRPGAVRAGEYRFDIGSAGSTTLVLQTVLPPLVLAEGPSSLLIEGGTHNPMAPPFDFLQRGFAPQLARCGPGLDLDLDRPGFHPAGGGRVRARIRPAAGLHPFELLERGAERGRRARACVAGLPRHIAERELAVVQRAGIVPAEDCVVEELRGARSPGNYLCVELEFENVTEVVTAIGRIGVPAERVARDAIREARNYLRSDAPVGAHLADQLLIPLALAGGGAFRTGLPTQHSRTNARVIERFLPVTITFAEEDAHTWRVFVRTFAP